MQGFGGATFILHQRLRIKIDYFLVDSELFEFVESIDFPDEVVVGADHVQRLCVVRLLHLLREYSQPHLRFVS